MHRAIAVPGLPTYDGTSVEDLAVGLAVGIAAAFVIAGVRRLAIGIDLSRGKRLSTPVLLLAGGLTVGVVAELADVLGAHADDVLFSGQASVPAVVAEDSAWIVLLLLAAKALGYAICLGCGFRGGPVFPAIFIGIALATFAVILFDVSPTLAVAVGSAACMAAISRLLFASVLFAVLLVGSVGVDATPAAVFAAGPRGSRRWRSSGALRQGLRSSPTRCRPSIRPPPQQRVGALGPGGPARSARLLRRLDLRRSGGRGEAACVAVFPADSEARRLLLEHLFDHAFARRLGDPLRLDDDQVSRSCRHFPAHLLGATRTRL
jgi:Voltage gated chloride channel